MLVSVSRPLRDVVPDCQVSLTCAGCTVRVDISSERKLYRYGLAYLVLRGLFVRLGAESSYSVRVVRPCPGQRETPAAKQPGSGRVEKHLQAHVGPNLHLLAYQLT